MKDTAVPLATDGLSGVRVIKESDAAVTVSTVDPVTEPEVAEIVVEPCASVEARPVVEIVATEGVADAHVTEFVRSSVELSE